MDEPEPVSRLRAGDEAAFRELVARYGGRLSRLARSFARSDVVIEEAVQETWLAVIKGIHGFEGRSPLSRGDEAPAIPAPRSSPGPRSPASPA